MRIHEVDIITKNAKGGIKKFFFPLIIAFLCLQASSVNSETLVPSSKSHDIIVALSENVIKEIAASETDPCLQPDDFHHYSKQEHLLSLNIFCRALKAVNYKFTVKFSPIPNVARGEWVINEGKAHVLLNLVQSTSIDAASADSIIYSEVVRNDDSRYSAFFSSVNNQVALTANSLADIQKLKAAVPNRWAWQQEKLDRLNIDYYPLQYQNLFKFINSQRADIVLLDMKGDNPTEKTMFGISLKATGKIYFVESKAVRFALSKNIEGSDKLMFALSAGLKKLKVTGIIDEVFAGMAPDTNQLKGWKKISLPPKKSQ